MEINPAYLDVLLATEDRQILKSMNVGLSDVQSIHFMTGIPVPCIERRMRAFMNLKLVDETMNGYILTRDEGVLEILLHQKARA
jgi:hypothetical protein